uniref:helicase HerA domain-containing protein n=1 Tax=Psychromonas aquimarina TaxID=444919 RepID=UPI00048F9446
ANLVEDNIEHAEELINALEWSRQTLASEAIVSLTTAHLSKGLEADNVFISDDFHSIIEAFTNGKAINESDLYLFYVAITRAKKSLMLPDALYMALEENKQFKVTKNKLLPCQTDNLQHLLNDPGINKQEVKKRQVEPEQSEKPRMAETKPKREQQPTEKDPLPLESLDVSKPKSKPKARSSKTPPTVAKSGKSPLGVDFDAIAIEIGQCKDTGEGQYWTPTDTNRYLNPNFAVLGTMGTGKTQAVKSMLLQFVQQKSKNTDGLPFGLLVFDYKNDYTDQEFTSETGAIIYEANSLPINPLALFSKDKLAPIRTCKGVVSTIAKSFNLGRNQQNALKKCIMMAYERNGIDNGDPTTFTNPAPTLNDVYTIYNNRDKVPQDSLTAALDDIVDFELFEKKHRKCKNLFDTMKDNMIVINLSGVDANLQNLIVAILLDGFFIQMHVAKKPAPSPDGHRAITNMFLVDEADSFLSQNFDSLHKLLKQGREFGVGAILSTQGIDHFKTDERDYSSMMSGYLIHRLENPKPAAVSSLFNQNDKAQQNDTLFKVRELKKHHSLLIDGKKQITYQESTAFWKII